MTDIDWSERIDQAIREYPEVGEYLEAIRGNIEALASRLAAVEEVHERREYWTETGEDICDTCSRRKQGDFVYWPCDTIKAARGE